MQKVLDLLEKHVQWVALGLGALWLLFMAWSYVINPPAKVTIGSADLKAADVDEYTLKNAVGPLENEMKPGKEVPAMQVDQFAERWQERMEWNCRMGCQENEWMLASRDCYGETLPIASCRPDHKRTLAQLEWTYIQNHAGAKTSVVEEILSRARP